jgi:hypothetical protein
MAWGAQNCKSGPSPYDEYLASYLWIKFRMPAETTFGLPVKHSALTQTEMFLKC